MVFAYITHIHTWHFPLSVYDHPGACKIERVKSLWMKQTGTHETECTQARNTNN